MGRPKGSTNNPKSVSGVQKYVPKTNLAAPPPEADDKIYYCTSCGKGFLKLKGNFRASQSPFYQGWGYVPVCLKCLSHFEKEYTERLGSNDEAIKRLALHFDLYLNESLLNSSKKVTSEQCRIAGYIANANLLQYKGKTYDTYLEELAEQERLNDKIGRAGLYRVNNVRLLPHRRTHNYFRTGRFCFNSL